MQINGQRKIILEQWLVIKSIWLARKHDSFWLDSSCHGIYFRYKIAFGVLNNKSGLNLFHFLNNILQPSIIALIQKPRYIFTHNDKSSKCIMFSVNKRHSWFF